MKNVMESATYKENEALLVNEELDDEVKGNLMY